MQQTSHILLVEDNPDDEALTLRALKKNGINNPVAVARDGEEALHALTGSPGQRPPLPSVVLLDIKLPKINGLEVLQHIRQEMATRLLPVVILTSSREDRDLRKAYQLGANSYIRKPVESEQFNEIIRQLGQYWLTLNEPPPHNQDVE
jgi:two-component system response regulator